MTPNLSRVSGHSCNDFAATNNIWQDGICFASDLNSAAESFHNIINISVGSQQFSKSHGL